jgi:hypothetical protein
MTMSSPCTRGHGRTIALGLACCALAACSGSPASPGPDAGTVVGAGGTGSQTGSSSGGGTGLGSSSSGGTGLGSSSSGGTGLGSSSSGGTGLGSSSSGAGSGGLGGSSSSSSGSSGGSSSGSGSSGAMTMTGTDGGGSGGGSGDGGSGACAGVFCDNFESSTTLGSAWTTDNTLGATVKVVNTYTTTPGPTMAHSGTNSVQISFTTGSGYAMIVEKMGFPATAGYWGRVWYYVEVPATDTGHCVYIEGSTGMNLGNNGVRPLNTSGGSMEINIDPATGGGEASASTNTPIPKGAWTCFEWNITATGGMGSVSLYVAGAATAAATVKNQTIPALTEQRVGYERYNAGTAGNVWLDDYAIGTSRIGCN